LSLDQMRAGVDRLKLRIAELEAFDTNSIARAGDPRITALATSIEETLQRVFGARTIELSRYHGAAKLHQVWGVASLYAAKRQEAPPSELQGEFSELKAQSLALLGQAVKGLEEDIAAGAGAPAPAIPAAHPKPSDKVFLVHGRDDATKNEVALFLRSIGLEPIILHTRPHRGRNILTKFQEESEGAAFAVILMTPDDEGALVGGTPQKRARQNVVFELGFFIGKLGTPNVAALVKGHIERPSDFDGIGYIDFDPNGEWKRLLAREMHDAQIPFDASKVFTA
jgi:predicted nucleotide-binding protein